MTDFIARRARLAIEGFCSRPSRRARAHAAWRRLPRASAKRVRVAGLLVGRLGVAIVWLFRWRCLDADRLRSRPGLCVTFATRSPAPRNPPLILSIRAQPLAKVRPTDLSAPRSDHPANERGRPWPSPSCRPRRPRSRPQSPPLSAAARSPLPSWRSRARRPNPSPISPRRCTDAVVNISASTHGEPEAATVPTPQLPPGRRSRILRGFLQPARPERRRGTRNRRPQRRSNSLGSGFVIDPSGHRRHQQPRDRRRQRRSPSSSTTAASSRPRWSARTPRSISPCCG